MSKQKNYSINEIGQLLRELSDKVEDVRPLQGKDLIFISWINRDGSGVTKVSKGMREANQKEKYLLNCLSLSEKTYIASGFNSFVVRLKKTKKK